MIEKIISEIDKLIESNEEESNACYPSAIAREYAYYECKEIVQEVAKEYGKDTNVPSNEWIPVETELPTKKGWYRVTCEDKEIWKEPIVRDLYYYPALNSFIDNIRYSEHGCNDIMNYNWTKYVTAWKPMDTPYQKGE